MKYCEEYAALLDLYVDGELSGEEAARVRAHLESCPSCQAYVDGALAIRAAFPEAEETVVPEGFVQGVMAAVQAEEARSRARKNGRWKQILLPLAACFAVAVVLRTVPGGGNTAGVPAAADTAAPAAVNNAAAPAGDSGGGQYGPAGIAPQMAAVPEALPENDVETRTASGDSSPETTAPTAADAPAALFSVSPEEHESGTAPVGGRRMPDQAARVIRLTADQAGELLSDLVCTAEEDGGRWYQLTWEEFDALLAALAEREIVPEEGTASVTEDFSTEYDLVYVTEE